MDFRKEDKIAELLAKSISGGITSEEQAVLDEWAARAAANKSVYDEAAEGVLVGNYDRAAAGIDKAGEQAAINARIGGRRRSRLARRLAGATAAAAVLVGAIIILWNVGRTDDKLTRVPAYENHMAVITIGNTEPVYLTDNENELEWRGVAEAAPASEMYVVKIAIPRGSEYKIRLSDGTLVWLNSETTIEYPKEFTGDKRNVRLTGEAYFEVARDEERPFSVTLANAEVRVLGTSFNVSAYPSDDTTLATLVSGSVEVAAGKNTVRLTPGSQAAVSTTGAITTREVNTALYTSWTQGFFEFDGMRLYDICAQLSRWYDVEFEFEGDSGYEQFAGAVWKYKPLNEFLEKIGRVTDVAFSYRDGKVTVRPKR